ncbi:26019_t:CDS:1, partial [Gigaspora margarita]
SMILPIERSCRNRISDISASDPTEFNLACRLEIRLIIILLARFLKLPILE